MLPGVAGRTVVTGGSVVTGGRFVTKDVVGLVGNIICGVVGDVTGGTVGAGCVVGEAFVGKIIGGTVGGIAEDPGTEVVIFCGKVGRKVVVVGVVNGDKVGVV